MADAPARPFGRNLADFLDGDGRLPAPEQKLREACAQGEWCNIGAVRPKAADLLLPVISLQQDSEWSPVVGGGSGAWYWPGIGLRGVMWTIILFGWVASLMLIAILTNLVKKD